MKYLAQVRWVGGERFIDAPPFEWVTVAQGRTVPEADEQAVLCAMGLLQDHGCLFESRVVDARTGEVDHEHKAPRLIAGWN